MADDAEKTEVFICLNEKENNFFFYAKAAMATEVKSFSRF